MALDDDNVHYQNAELLANELIKYKKGVLYAVPNRSHSIREENAYPHVDVYRFFKKKLPSWRKIILNTKLLNLVQLGLERMF